ncbi:hypothetical protein K443DRAFT_172262 [Laccaria amethystina LaAM-08-1]|uniref:C2H2-type domain-containing protein n=1 Tax=Laccaria amethystina LaAM-08-1 TaxID=1095629 RepID=A0A0C9XU27_9AGAR|nr:hypothetical protein K443DRAFT_172262 [Laccaria amethystina LaAM-08-1]
MQPGTCELCLFSLALCPCYSKPSQLSVFPQGAFIDSGGQAWISPADSIRSNVEIVDPPPRRVLPGDVLGIGLIPPMNPLVAETDAELPARAVVASPEHVSAANRRRTNAVPGRFVCNLCPQDFTAKHNLKNHINSHFQIKAHRCLGGCGKSFGTKSSLNRHRKSCKAKGMALGT